MNCNYPTNAKMLRAYRGVEQRKFCFLANVSESKNEISVTIEPDSLIVVSNMDLARRVQNKTGIRLPTRREIADKRFTGCESLFILGVSAILEIQIGNERFLPLLQRDLNAPSNSGKWTSPGGLCNQLPIECMQEELAEEIALVRKTGKLEGLRIIVPVFEQFYENSEKVRQLIELKNWQKPFIDKQLQKFYETTAFEYEALKIKQLKMPENVKKVTIKMPDDEEQIGTDFIACLDQEISGITLCAHFLGNVADDSKYQLIDPEPFERNVNLVTEEEFKVLECTTALACARSNGICFHEPEIR